MAIHIHVHTKAKARDAEPQKETEISYARKVIKTQEKLIAEYNRTLATRKRDLQSAQEAVNNLPNRIKDAEKTIAKYKAELSKLGVRDASSPDKRTVTYNGLILNHVYSGTSEYDPTGTWQIAKRGNMSRVLGFAKTLEGAKREADKILADWDKLEKDEAKAKKLFAVAQALVKEVEAKEDRGVTVTPAEREKMKRAVAEYSNVDVMIRHKVGNL